MIAIVDNDEGVRHALSGMLRSLGYNALSFSSGADFLCSTERDRPSCVITDMHVPELSGLEARYGLADDLASGALVESEGSRPDT